VRDTVQRGIVVHDSAVTVDGNVVFNTVGHNVVVETETTEGAVINGNLALVNKLHTPLVTNAALQQQNDQLPSNFWIKSARNTITNNAAAGSLSNGFIYDVVGNGPIDFRNNLAHAAMAQGVTGDFNMGSGLLLHMTRDGLPEDRLSDFTVYHSIHGFWPENDGGYTVSDSRGLRADRVMAYHNAANIFARGPGNKVVLNSPVVVGGAAGNGARLFPNERGVANQYGSEQIITNPVFANFSGPDYVSKLLSGHDISAPINSGFTITNARMINVSSTLAPDGSSWSSFNDDSMYPRGSYVSIIQPFVATAECSVMRIGVAGEEESFYRCPRRYGYAEIDVRTLAAPTVRYHEVGNIVRSDGLRFKGAGYTDNNAPTKFHGGMSGYAALWDAGLSYTLESPSASGYAIRLSAPQDITVAEVMREQATIQVSIPVSAPPRGVYRSGSASVDYNDRPASYTAANSLRAAASRTELAANPLTTYFYDATARQVVVHASARWLTVVP
jgi:hypothetical protein